ncbi:MAG: branched-chain amino acid transaminase [Chloroflexi bacterium]|nr:branched-chain amino acid transaminase [Chloroflexota bacterium]
MAQYAFFDNKFVPLAEAKVSVMTHAMHYGTGCFEGIRGNWNDEQGQMYLFRVADHYRRLLQSARILRMELPYTVEQLCDTTRELVEKCGFKEDVYVRPLAYKSSEVIGVRLHNLDAALTIFVVPFGNYLDVTKGIRACVSTWRRIDDNMIPPRAKITGLYVNSALAKSEAAANGYDEAILLTREGHVSEGSGENLFLVTGGRLITPPPYDNILVGITRDTAIELAKNEMGLETEERCVDRTELYLAQECFLTGTAAHVTPVLEIDGRPVGNGQVGPVARRIQELYFDVVRGRNRKYLGWCTPAYSNLVKA